ncbi:MAG: iron-containing alcohol dehydrogenase, partial [Woeseiaceae bacterium]
MDFRYRGLPWNIVFGVGSLERLPAEMDGISCTSALVLTTPAQASDGHRIADLLGDRCVGLFDRAAMHVPARIVAEARDLAGRLGADCTVSIGGGSTTGLGKALALRANLDNVAIPTTYA